MVRHRMHLKSGSALSFVSVALHHPHAAQRDGCGCNHRERYIAGTFIDSVRGVPGRKRDLMHLRNVLLASMHLDAIACGETSTTSLKMHPITSSLSLFMFRALYLLHLRQSLRSYPNRCLDSRGTV